MNLRKLLAAQFAACVVFSNAYYVFFSWSLWVPIVLGALLCAITFLTVRAVCNNTSIAFGAATWVGSLNATSLLFSISMRPRSGFDAGIYDRVPLLLGFACAALSILFWKLLPWEHDEATACEPDWLAKKDEHTYVWERSNAS